MLFIANWQDFRLAFPFLGLPVVPLAAPSSGVPVFQVDSAEFQVRLIRPGGPQAQLGDLRWVELHVVVTRQWVLQDVPGSRGRLLTDLSPRVSPIWTAIPFDKTISAPTIAHSLVSAKTFFSRPPYLWSMMFREGVNMSQPEVHNRDASLHHDHRRFAHAEARSLGGLQEFFAVE